MYFSDLFGIEDPDQYEWLDLVLERDTLLFADPFLIFQDEDDSWAHAHDRMMDYFHDAFVLLAKSGLRESHQYYRRVLTLMEFPEPREFRLGYAGKNPDGSGAGPGLARQVVEAMGQAINRGLDDLQHFEELGILVEGINRDRISDITCNLLKPEFIRYTQDVCRTHGILMQERPIKHGVFDKQRQRWLNSTVQVPIDPQTSRPILLIPKRFLGELPTLNAENWYDELDSSIREDLNLSISSGVRKSEIIQAARRNPESVRAWVRKQEESRSEPYDVDEDPKLYVKWQKVAREAAASRPITNVVIASNDDLLAFVHLVIDRVRHWAEDQGGWRALWAIMPNSRMRNGKAIPEPSMQVILLGMMDAHCESAGIRLDREVETGRGPVDFTFSGNFRTRVLVEMKKLTHGEFWSGLNVQTPLYMKGLGVDHAIFLAVRDSDTAPMRLRWTSLKSAALTASEESALRIEVARIDILPKPSASKAGKQRDDETD